MGKVLQEPIGCFNPFEMDAFRRPVCRGSTFYALTPYGGVWCGECNASFKVSDTCDGLRKLAVRCLTEDCHTPEHREQADRYGTVIWEGDERISWMRIKDRELEINAVVEVAKDGH